QPSGHDFVLHYCVISEKQPPLTQQILVTISVHEWFPPLIALRTRATSRLPARARTPPTRTNNAARCAALQDAPRLRRPMVSHQSSVISQTSRGRSPACKAISQKKSFYPP